MSKLSDLLKDTNDNIVKGWAFQLDEDQNIRLLKLDAIETEEDGLIDEHVATIYVMEDFMKFLEEEVYSQGGSDVLPRQ